MKHNIKTKYYINQLHIMLYINIKLYSDRGRPNGQYLDDFKADSLLLELFIIIHLVDTVE